MATTIKGKDSWHTLTRNKKERVCAYVMKRKPSQVREADWDSTSVTYGDAVIEIHYDEPQMPEKFVKKLKLKGNEAFLIDVIDKLPPCVCRECHSDA